MGKAGLHLFALVEPCSLVLRPSDPSSSQALRSPPPWPPRSWQPPSPLGSQEAESCLGQAGSPMDSVTTPDTRWVLWWACVPAPHAAS